MLEIGMKVCWIGEGSLSASFLNFLISVADTFPLFSSLFVALSTPLTNRVSLTLILLALDISLMSTLEQAETPSSPTDVGPAAETQAFTWKSLSLYDSELSAKTICWNLDPRLWHGSHVYLGKYDILSKNCETKVSQPLMASSLNSPGNLQPGWTFFLSLSILCGLKSFLSTPPWSKICHFHFLWAFSLCCRWYSSAQSKRRGKCGAQAWLCGQWLIQFLGTFIVIEFAAWGNQGFLGEAFWW